MAEKVAQLSEEQWNVVKAALDGEIADLRIQNLLLEAEAVPLRVALKEMRGLPLRHKKIPYTLGACASSCVACQRDRILTDAGKGWIIDDTPGGPRVLKSPPGWVSPEVTEQVRGDLEAGLHLMSARDDPTAYSYVKDALDALKGVE